MRKPVNPVLLIFGIVLFCFSLNLPGVAQESEYDALLGEWDVETEDGQFVFVFTFTMEEDTLTGSFEGPTGDLEMEDISFEENELMFTDAGGQIMVVDFFATIEEDSLEGFLSLEMGEMNISGKKRSMPVS
jgi:hypothetical protein